MSNHKKELIEKIMKKPELKEIPKEDVEMALSLCFKKQNSDEENIECARRILHKVYGAFGSKKLFTAHKKERTPEWILRKHLSTRERLKYYEEIYKRIFGNLNDFEGTIFDLGAGVNGFSLGFLPKAKYIGIEGIGQLVTLMNNYFKTQKYNAKAIHLSLFKLEKIKKLIKEEKGKKIILLFKVLDSLEVLKKDYSKKLLLELTPMAEKIVISLATRSMITRKKFDVNRNWIVSFIKKNFNLIDDFEVGGERYLILTK